MALEGEAESVVNEMLPGGDDIEIRGPAANRETAEPLTPADRIRQATVIGDAIKTLRKPNPLIDGFLYRNSLAAIYGVSGAFKTFLAVAMALSIATGRRWAGQEVTQGRVLYVVAEGAAGIGDRVSAWQEHEGLPQITAIDWLPVAVPLTNPGWSGALREVVGERGYDAVFIDTAARSMVGADENSAKDMGLFVDGLDQVRRVNDALVAFVHHTGKTTENGMRGSSALRAAVDTELEVRSADGIVTVRTTKQKNAAEEPPRHFRVRTVGESCALEAHSGPLTGSEMPAKLEALLEALRSVQADVGATTKVWQLAADVPERSFYRARSSLVENGLVTNIGTDARPRYVVTATATATANTANGSTVELLPATATPLGVAVGSNGGSTVDDSHDDHRFEMF